MSDQTPGYADQDRMPENVGPIPGIPPTPGIPQIPDTPDMPDLPNMPDTPENPGDPSIPQTPDTPDLPNYPDPDSDPPEWPPREPEPPVLTAASYQEPVETNEPAPGYTLADLRIEALSRAIMRYPQTPINYLLRGELYLSLNQIEAAAADFERALTLASAEAESLTWGYANAALIDRVQDGLRQVAHHAPAEPVTSRTESLPDPV